MAQRRMFSLHVVDTDAFLEMPASTQNLYFHLGMRADDDGFVSNPKKIMKIINANNDDLKILFTKRFILGFDNGVIVIKHWKMHNYIAKDRYKETVYTEEKNTLSIKDNGAYTECIQVVYDCETQVRLGKDSIGKDSIENNEEIIYTCKYFSVNNQSHAEYQALYHHMNVMNEYVKMKLWLDSNPSKRKSNYPRFINSWLKRSAVDTQKIEQSVEKTYNYPDLDEYQKSMDKDRK